MSFLKRLLLLWLLTLPTIMSVGQSSALRGRVVDSKSGQPLPGVTVTLKATNQSTTTDDTGQFSISSGSGTTFRISVSYVGYSSQELSVKPNQEITIQLMAAENMQDEVVVVAYGSQKKTSLTSSVATVNAKKLTDAPTANITNTLGGRAPGILFKQSSGEPGYDEATIRIRGIGTIGNANALIIIDGVERPLSSVDPHDIESFSILKDAASVAPYGVRGANGIVLITTKRGTASGKFSVNYDGKTGWSRPVTLPKTLSSFEWATLKNEGARNEGLSEPYDAEDLQKFKDGSDPDFYANENGVKRLLKTGRLHQHNLSVTGGNKTINFYGSVGYVDQTAMWGSVTNFKRYTIRSNVDFRISENTKAGIDYTGIFRDAKYPGAAGGPGFILFGLWRLNPTNPIFYQDGKPAGYFERNPYLDLYESGYFKEDDYSQYVTLKLEQKIPFVKGLVLRGNFSIDKTEELDKQWRTPYTFYEIRPGTPPTYISGKGNVPKPSLSERYNSYRRLNTQVMVAFNRAFKEHQVDVLGVFEPRVDNYRDFGAGRTNYELFIDELSNSGNSNAADRTNSGGSSKITQVGYVYKAGYNFASKYFFEAAGRYDGQSYFSPVAKYAFFPSFSGAWRVSEESFMKNFAAISNLKIRGSWGIVGNLADQSFQYLRLYGLGSTYLFNNIANASVYEVREPSPRITWEKAIKTDIGFELSMWGGKLNLEFDYFSEKRNDMLIASTAILPAEYGIGIGQENTGKMENRGIDFKISSFYPVSKQLSLSGAFNFTYAKNKIININESESIRANPNRTQIGKPFNQPFGYQALGLFQSQEEIEKTPYTGSLANKPKPGDVKYADINNDGKLNADDIVPIGKPNFPEIIYGFEGGIAIQNLTIDMLWQGAANVNYYLSGWAALPFNQSNGTAFRHHTDVWRPDNTGAEFPRILTNPGANAYNNFTSSFWQRSGNYLRLKTLSVGYSFPRLVKGLNNLKLYAAGQNLLTFTKTKYWDPESPNTTDYYYQERVISVGATVNF
ncbi:TonB-dependent receptor [Flavihumibacter sp. CACIAM 22H1]|uniref:SusC/RagA family TonB-linked outer membrane protein n=1 Tax=Flavihumibacter sp. CACIAM 22H1 TaxID=1812911 RepID=UPI0007A89344|nr:TonB-dependent receptor [Flavihumibacter sp. CACIAM 22H1]KYP16344.1 MAG: hypothetical protein A1D16_16900 [Flavihumibacter sp. CACIAM 22H1]